MSVLQGKQNLIIPYDLVVVIIIYMQSLQPLSFYCLLNYPQIGRLLMRKVISEFTQLPYNEVILKRTEKGKPYLVCMKNDGSFSDI